MRRSLLLFLLLLLFLPTPLLLPHLARAGDWRGLTGEEDWRAQVRGLGHWLSGRVRPYPATEPLQPVRHAGLYPFGINTFLQTETEPDKVEQSLDMIAAAGFRWIRQEFPWEDLEIHRDDWFVDLRNPNEVHSSWAKYDRIVALSEARGIGIIARLSTPPTWSRAAGDAAGTRAPADSLQAYGDYVEAVVTRYRGRVRYYQIWNEPNCCQEWGTQAVSPEQYVALLREAHTRAHAADPDVVILTAPLAPTIEMVEQTVTGAAPALNDFLYLQRMYDADARPFFDVLAMQDYGLWSGPTDRRMRPRVLNFSRPEYIRDIMLRNGDGAKAVWVSEMGWNSAPPPVPDDFGRIAEELRSNYLVEAFERQAREWPWMGVTTVWFFKRAGDEEQDQSFYYFRLVEPDFTAKPAWDALSAYLHTLQPTLYRGWHQEDHWVLREGLAEGAWPLQAERSAIFEQAALGAAGATLRFAVEGEALTLLFASPPSAGVISVQQGNEAARRIPVGQGAFGSTPAAPGTSRVDLGPVSAGRIEVTLTVESGTVALDGVIVE